MNERRDNSLRDLIFNLRDVTFGSCDKRDVIRVSDVTLALRVVI